jgi:hypothetical protein
MSPPRTSDPTNITPISVQDPTGAGADMLYGIIITYLQIAVTLLRL